MSLEETMVPPMKVKWLFVALETIVGLAFLFHLIAEKFLGVHLEMQSRTWSAVLGIPVALAWLFLLIVSPFFLRSLRGVALVGWIMAFAILLIGALTPNL